MRRHYQSEQKVERQISIPIDGDIHIGSSYYTKPRTNKKGEFVKPSVVKDQETFDALYKLYNLNQHGDNAVSVCSKVFDIEFGKRMSYNFLSALKSQVKLKGEGGGDIDKALSVVFNRVLLPKVYENKRILTNDVDMMNSEELGIYLLKKQLKTASKPPFDVKAQITGAEILKRYQRLAMNQVLGKKSCDVDLMQKIFIATNQELYNHILRYDVYRGETNNFSKYAQTRIKYNSPMTYLINNGVVEGYDSTL